MIKNKLDFKLINMAIILFIFFLFYLSGSFWISILSKGFRIITPFVIAFAIAHALFPVLKNMINRGIPKAVGIIIILTSIFGIMGLIISLLMPIIFEQTISLFSSVTNFIHSVSTHYNLNLGNLQSALSDSFNDILKRLGNYVSDGAFVLINKSLAFVSTLIITIFVAMYLLIDMDKIRDKVKIYLQSTNKKTFSYIKQLDHEIIQYFIGLSQLMAWQLFEYTIIYYFIGHPHFLLIGILAAITTIVPYLGALATNIIALITAFAISANLFILTIITIVVISAVDSYIIAPKIFGGTNKIHPLLIIFAVFSGGVIAGIPGIILALPLTIILVTTFKFYYTDIYKKLKPVNK